MCRRTTLSAVLATHWSGRPRTDDMDGGGGARSLLPLATGFRFREYLVIGFKLTIDNTRVQFSKSHPEFMMGSTRRPGPWAVGSTSEFAGPVLHCAQDDSVDTSYTKVQDEGDLAEPHFVKNVYGDIGTDTQGPAGARVPEEGYNGATEGSNEPMADVKGVYDAEPKFINEEGAPEEDVEERHSMEVHLGSFTVEELCGSDEISAAALASAAIHARHSNTETMLHDMEEAEAAYGAAHLNTNLQLEKGRSQVADQPSKVMRDRIEEKLKDALRGNPCFANEPDAHISSAAVVIEQSLHEVSRSLVVYLGIASNAVRLAGKATSIDEILQVARRGGGGGPQANHEDIMHDLSGMQEIAVKLWTDL